ncbi:MAG: ABC transporter permease [Chloroflexota bacterium]|nr:ABC transporter permease [Chloroflexota bacterium]
MEILQQAWDYASDPSNDFWKSLLIHLELSGSALAIAIVIGVSLGIVISRYGAFARLVVNFVGVMRVIPSIAVLFILLPLLHTGLKPSIAALSLLAIPPLLINTDAGMRGVDKAVIEAGRGLGMSSWRLLWKVQMPLALPVVLAGLRIATVEVVASATLATLIGGGGLGDFIAIGLSQLRNEVLLVGAIPVALLAIISEVGLSYLQRRIVAQTHTR